MSAGVKDYEAIARILGEEMGVALAKKLDDAPINMAANRIANWFKERNPRFNEGTFFGRIADVRAETEQLVMEGKVIP